jgi:hypothetical protein
MTIPTVKGVGGERLDVARPRVEQEDIDPQMNDDASVVSRVRTG